MIGWSAKRIPIISNNYFAHEVDSAKEYNRREHVGTHTLRPRFRLSIQFIERAESMEKLLFSLAATVVLVSAGIWQAKPNSQSAPDDRGGVSVAELLKQRAELLDNLSKINAAI